MKQVTAELTTGIIVEANETRLVIEINKSCYLNVMVGGFPHDHKAGDVVPILTYLKMKENPDGQASEPPKQ